MFGIKKGTIIRSAVLVLAIVNTSLQLFGVEVLPFTEEDVELALTAILNAGAAMAAWWKNNSFSKEAKATDAELDRKKSAKKTAKQRRKKTQEKEGNK